MSIKELRLFKSFFMMRLLETKHQLYRNLQTDISRQNDNAGGTSRHLHQTINEYTPLDRPSDIITLTTLTSSSPQLLAKFKTVFKHSNISSIHPQHLSRDALLFNKFYHCQPDSLLRLGCSLFYPPYAPVPAVPKAYIYLPARGNTSTFLIPRHPLTPPKPKPAPICSQFQKRKREKKKKKKNHDIEPQQSLCRRLFEIYDTF